MCSSQNEMEYSAGAAVIFNSETAQELLLIRVRSFGYELPKGHLEPGETALQAALRELSEETGLLSRVSLISHIGDLEYEIAGGKRKHVSYFLFLAEEPPTFDKKPERTRELRWIRHEELDSISLVNPALHTVLLEAFTRASSTGLSW